MSQTNEPDNTNLDDLLAEFTDQTLDGNADQAASSPDPELFRLEETVLRLRRAFPPASVDDASRKQMLVRLNARMKRGEKTEQPSFWKRWFDLRSSPQAGMVLAAAVVVALMVLVIPLLTSTGSSVSGTAGNPGGSLIAVGLISILLLVYWIARKK